MRSNLLLLLLFSLSLTPASEAKPCAQGYFEGAHLSRVATNTGFLYAKAGFCESPIEWGLVARAGADTRTASDSSNAIFNDNYLFIGAGVSWINALPGVKFVGEAGYSFDLSSKIKRAGGDFRLGWQSYHEVPVSKISAIAEFYSEGFYVHRYKNFILDFQPKLFWGFLHPEKSVTVGPLLGLNYSLDTSDFDYNRFLEMNYGIKGKWFPASNTEASGFSLGLQLYGVRGFRTDANTSLAAYSDFRMLLFGYFSID